MPLTREFLEASRAAAHEQQQRLLAESDRLARQAEREAGSVNAFGFLLAQMEAEEKPSATPPAETTDTGISTVSIVSAPDSKTAAKLALISFEMKAKARLAREQSAAGQAALEDVLGLLCAYVDEIERTKPEEITPKPADEPQPVRITPEIERALKFPPRHEKGETA